MVSRLSRRAVQPFSKQTWATSWSVHRWAGLPRLLGDRRNRARRSPSRDLGQTEWMVLGLEGFWCRQASPSAVKARKVLRTAWAEQPSEEAIWEGR